MANYNNPLKDTESGDARISLHKIPTPLISKLKKYDSDNSGYVPVSGIISALMDARDKNRAKRYLLFSAVGLFAIFSLITMGLTYVVVNNSKESHVNAYNNLIGNNGLVLSTSISQAFTEVSSDMAIDELSRLSAITISLNAQTTTIKLAVDNYLLTPCFSTQGFTCVPETPNILFIFSHALTVMIYGTKKIIMPPSTTMEKIINDIPPLTVGGRKILGQNWDDFCELIALIFGPSQSPSPSLGRPGSTLSKMTG
jgi:hypothetical protein